ncbi:hypothetical protein GCM10027063_45530 [Promicromonospora xylanilytica]
MSDYREHRPELENLDSGTKRSLQPIPVVVGFSVVVLFVAGILSGAAPDLFQSAGGWVTAIIVVVVAVIIGSLLTVRRMNAHNRQS